MNDLAEETQEAYDEGQKMPSRNHSFVQTRLAGLLLNDDRFTPFVELSLDVSQIDLSQFGLKIKEEIIPDVCIYPNSIGFNDEDDDLKMQEMPLLAIEIISPKQAFSDILAKFKAYFSLGMKSCWLVMPMFKSIAVYSQAHKSTMFDLGDTEVIDKVMDIHLPIDKIFGQ